MKAVDLRQLAYQDLSARFSSLHSSSNWASVCGDWRVATLDKVVIWSAPRRSRENQGRMVNSTAEKTLRAIGGGQFTPVTLIGL